MKKILILGAGQMQIPVIQKVNHLGYISIVADYNPEAPGFKYAKYKEVVSTDDFDSLSLLAVKYKIDAVLTTSDFPTTIVARLAEKYNLKAMSVKCAEICTNKFLQRQLLAENKHPVPKFELYSFVDSSNLCDFIRDVKDKFKLPFVIKPVDSSASRGVYKIEDLTQLDIYLQEAISFSKSKSVIIESYIQGREFSVESFTQNEATSIINITEKLLIGQEYGCFVENAHIEPANITSEEKIKIEELVKSVINLFGINNAPTHIELKIDGDNIYIIEVACRLGGDYITSDLVPLSTGVDMLENLIKVSLGLPIQSCKSFDKYSAIQFINPSNYYKVIEFVNSNDKSIIRFEIEEYRDVLIKNSLDRLGYIIIQTEDRERLDKILIKLS